MVALIQKNNKKKNKKTHQTSAFIDTVNIHKLFIKNKILTIQLSKLQEHYRVNIHWPLQWTRHTRHKRDKNYSFGFKIFKKAFPYSGWHTLATEFFLPRALQLNVGLKVKQLPKTIKSGRRVWEPYCYLVSTSIYKKQRWITLSTL